MGRGVRMSTTGQDRTDRRHAGAAETGGGVMMMTDDDEEAEDLTCQIYPPSAAAAPRGYHSLYRKKQTSSYTSRRVPIFRPSSEASCPSCVTWYTR